MPWDPKISDEELAERMVQIQAQDPLRSEAKICLELGVSREYIWRRSKSSEAVSNARKKTKLMREVAYAERGIEMMDTSDKDRKINPAIYIWLTKNMLGWRDQPEAEPDEDESYPEPDL